MSELTPIVSKTQVIKKEYKQDHDITYKPKGTDLVIKFERRKGNGLPSSKVYKDNVEHGYLAKNTTILGVTFKAQSELLVELKDRPMKDSSGKIIGTEYKYYTFSGKLAHDQNINGAVYMGGETIVISNETSVRIPNGMKVLIGKLAKNYTIDSLVFKAGSTIEFYENGKVKGGYLAKDAVLKGETYQAGTRIFIDIKDTSVLKEIF